VIEFVVEGPAATKGSTRIAVIRARGRRSRLGVVADCRRLAPWSAAVAWTARAAGVVPVPKPGGVKILAAFLFARPAGSRARAAVRPIHTVKPDVDTLTRALLDALTGIAYVDDAQVVAIETAKQYAEDGRARTVVQVIPR
jgi:crossover junction endodeoxyribonuclease RusA